MNSEAELNYFKRVLNITKDARYYLAKGPPFPEWLENELFDESKIEEEPLNNIKPRIGKKYQIYDIPTIINKYK